jgi:glyoxalase family protein
MSVADVTGLHHVTAITGSAQRNHDFYTRGLGLRLVKQTVNFDDPGAWHLYYADGTGTPGSVMTFFAWPGSRPGRRGAGQVIVTQFAVPRGSLPFWRGHLPNHGAEPLGENSAFGEARALFAGPDGLTLALVETDDPRTPWTTPMVGEAVAIRGFRGVTLRVADLAGIAPALTGALDYAETAREGRTTRYTAPTPAGIVDVEVDPTAASGRDGAGAVHHVAFRVADRAAQGRVRARLQSLGLRVTEAIDRDYFWAIYTRTPSGVLVEVATDEPGFTVDEAPEALGTALKLPRQHEHLRARIEQVLPPLTV